MVQRRELRAVRTAVRWSVARAGLWAAGERLAEVPQVGEPGGRDEAFSGHSQPNPCRAPSLSRSLATSGRRSPSRLAPVVVRRATVQRQWIDHGNTPKSDDRPLSHVSENRQPHEAARNSQILDKPHGPSGVGRAVRVTTSPEGSDDPPRAR